MKTLALVILPLSALTGIHQPNPELPRAEVVIRRISVLDPTAAMWLHDRDVIIRNGKFAAVQPAGRPVPAAKFTINGNGKFAIPGLFDQRVHLEKLDRAGAGLFVASGITSVWDTGTDAAKIARWRRDLSYGKFMGPRIVRSDAAAPAPQRERSAVALHEELAARVRAGQTPAAALRSATIEAATFHDRGQDLGSIEQGKIADLIVLGGDPLADIAHTRTIDAVVFRGEVLTRAHLNQLLSHAGRPGAR